MIRYLLLLSESEGIYCIGERPFVGDRLVVKKVYGERDEVEARVTSVTLTQTVRDAVTDPEEARGNQLGDVPEVRVEIISVRRSDGSFVYSIPERLL